MNNYIIKVHKGGDGKKEEEEKKITYIYKNGKKRQYLRIKD